MKKLLLVVVLAVAVYFAAGPRPGTPDKTSAITPASLSIGTSGSSLAALDKVIASHASGQQISGQGTVTRLLADDTNGSRHQRFIIRLTSGQTILVVHNIDLANRIDTLRAGDTVDFLGEYEWNPKGGLVHWTHHDPQGHHPSGWIKHDGQTYQ